MSGAVIFGTEGGVLSPWERDFLRDADPWGFILFDRNLGTPKEIRRLCGQMREAVGRDAPILIDQEGGRVQRLRPPVAREWMPPLDFVQGLPAGERAEAMRLRYRYIAWELRNLGIDVNCAPQLDVAVEETHPFLRNRCYGTEAEAVAEIGAAVAEGHLAGGVLPIAKHIPGHGRGTVDSHLDLPVVDADREALEVDFAPFAALKDICMAMTAHIVYPALDPEACATLSPVVIAHIRQEIGFDGLLMTDDLSMEALGGSYRGRVEGALKAGCDLILHCNGHRDEMLEIADATPALTGRAAERAEAALDQRREPEEFDAKGAARELDELEARAGG
ncbi:glycoside hydrolase family 3 N-terminal domain-containing protein [Roseobacter sp. HKCCA0434]|uniref:glycoside hydrolase family 3 N-terminal domain-containing protein n=1 Tax=Roseobacter sp. HKCCA0434 TaxID=3079297 RepID=UPI0029057EBD|nr:glycoside hydrolase family 3 N-terminal domain-containing protein [Roseobacter sp. HKCCA0434]